MAMDQYLYIPFLGGLFTSINPSYFDVNYRGIGFWPIPISHFCQVFGCSSPPPSVLCSTFSAPRCGWSALRWPGSCHGAPKPCYNDAMVPRILQPHGAGRGWVDGEWWMDHENWLFVLLFVIVWGQKTLNFRTDFGDWKWFSRGTHPKRINPLSLSGKWWSWDSGVPYYPMFRQLYGMA